MKRALTEKRDKLILNIIQNHIGLANAIPVKQLCKQLQENGFSIKPRNFCEIISNVKKKHSVPVCYARGKGYFIAGSNEDILITIQDLQQMINSLQEHIEFMQKFINYDKGRGENG